MDRGSDWRSKNDIYTYGSLYHLMMWTIGHSMYINGIGKIRLQLINAIVTGILYVPVALLLCKYIGINGILVALCLSQIINVFVAPIQCNKLISGTATGIWNK